MTARPSTVQTAPLSEFQQINLCAKRPIDIWTNYLYYHLSLWVVYLVRNVRAVSPNGVTLFSAFLALLGCVGYAVGSRPYVVTGLILVQVSYVFDCADGQLARYRKQYSPIGGWLDQIADRVKEFAVYFSLAYGYTRLHPGDTRIWMWAMVSLFSLYVLEYYGQVPMFKSPSSANPTAAVPSAAEADSFDRMQRLRSFVPFRGFIIGEQYFAMLVFLAFGAIFPFFVFVGIVGLAMCLYRPVIVTIKHRRANSLSRSATGSTAEQGE